MTHIDPTTGEVIEPAPATDVIAVSLSAADITALLNLYGELKNKLQLAEMDYADKRAALLRPLADKLAIEEAAFNATAAPITSLLAELDTRIRAATLAHGQKVVGAQWQAVYSNGKTSWDDKGLLKFAAQHPDVMRYRKSGEPSISLRITPWNCHGVNTKGDPEKALAAVPAPAPAPEVTALDVDVIPF